MRLLAYGLSLLSLTLSFACGGAECAVDTDCPFGNRCAASGSCQPVGDRGDTGVDAPAGDADTPDAADMGTPDVGEPDMDEPDMDPPEVAMVCTDVCELDEDCFAGGMDVGLICGEGNRCSTGDAPATCSDDIECVAQFSGWTMECDAAVACPSGPCVDVGGIGLCAISPADGACGFGEPFAVTDIGGAEVEVCARGRAACDAGVCFERCEVNEHCTSPVAPSCDADSGRCGCVDDAECAAAGPMFGVSVCVDSQCQCAADSDCEAVENADVCVSGACGCSGDAACTREPSFDGTTVTCG